MLSSPWKIELDQSKIFHKALTEQCQILRLSMPMSIDNEAQHEDMYAENTVGPVKTNTRAYMSLQDFSH